MNRVLFVMLVVVLMAVPHAVANGPRFVRTAAIADQPVVEDTVTGLSWQGCPAGLTGASCTTGSVSSMSWQAAMTYCEGLTWGGRSDWYLPDVNELTSIVDDSRIEPAINATAFPATPRARFWTSSSYSSFASFAFIVQFEVGIMSVGSKTEGAHVRCVRRGP